MTKGLVREFQNFDELAAKLHDRSLALASHAQHWIGVAGAPGSGKSTLAAALKERLGQLICIISLDGYHFYRRQLDCMENPIEAHARRGAPFTFDAKRFVLDLVHARELGEGVFPGFDHQNGDPRDAEIELTKIQRIVLVEGNYLLLDQEPWCQLRQQVFDQSWYLDMPLAVCNKRVLQRHLALGLTAEQATKRVLSNDAINGKLIEQQSKSNADWLIRIPQVTP